MFFDRRNCSRVVQLEELGYFIKDAISALELVYEQTLKEQAIQELNKSDSCNKSCNENNQSESKHPPETTGRSLKRKNDNDSEDMNKKIKDATGINIKIEKNCAAEAGTSFDDSIPTLVMGMMNPSHPNCEDPLVNVPVESKEDIRNLKLNGINVSSNVFPKKEKIDSEFQAVIKFKASLSWKEVQLILEKNGITGILDITVEDRKSIIMFATELNLQNLLKMNNKIGLKKLSAFSIQQLKKLKLQRTKKETKISPQNGTV